MVLFACCRESYIDGSKTGMDFDDIDVGVNFIDKNRRGNEVARSKHKPANFTLLFGCNPAEGVAADTKFVKCFIEHLK